MGGVGVCVLLAPCCSLWQEGVPWVRGLRWGQCCWVPGDPQPSPNRLLSPHLQLRRSPIKKVRKSLALDIVDEGGKLMSTLPKAPSLVRGLREAVPTQECRDSSAPGRMDFPWRWSDLGFLEVASVCPSAGRGLMGRVGLDSGPGFSQSSSVPVFLDGFIWQEFARILLKTMGLGPQHLHLAPTPGF